MTNWAKSFSDKQFLLKKSTYSLSAIQEVYYFKETIYRDLDGWTPFVCFGSLLCPQNRACLESQVRPLVSISLQMYPGYLTVCILLNFPPTIHALIVIPYNSYQVLSCDLFFKCSIGDGLSRWWPGIMQISKR